MKRLKFVSYSGEYPNLCSGKLVMMLDDKEIIFPNYCLLSHGGCDVVNGDTYDGEWEITRFPKDFLNELKDLANELVNNNVRHGCCGGCI